MDSSFRGAIWLGSYVLLHPGTKIELSTHWRIRTRSRASIRQIFKKAIEPAAHISQSKEPWLAAGNGRLRLAVSPLVFALRGCCKSAVLFVGGHPCSKMNGDSYLLAIVSADVNAYVE